MFLSHGVEPADPKDEKTNISRGCPRGREGNDVAFDTAVVALQVLGVREARRGEEGQSGKDRREWKGGKIEAEPK